MTQSILCEIKDVTDTYRSFDGRRATVADLIAHLRYVTADLDAAVAAGVLGDPAAAEGLARVIDHHRRQLEAELVTEAPRRVGKARASLSFPTGSAG